MTTLVIDFVNKLLYADNRTTWTHRKTGEEQLTDTTTKIVEREGWMFTAAGDVNDIHEFIYSYGGNNKRPKSRTPSKVVVFNEHGEISIYEVGLKRLKRHLLLRKSPVWEGVSYQSDKKYLTLGSGFRHARAVMEVTGDGDLAMKAAAKLDKHTSFTYDVVSFEKDG